jgi:hypothetical protein
MSESLESASSQPSASAAAAAASPPLTAAQKKRQRKKQKRNESAAAAVTAMDTSSEMSAHEMEAQRWLDSLKDEDLLNPQLMSDQYVSQLAAEFRAAQPYAHLCLTDLLDAAFARTLENELRGLEYYTKSSDLFEFAQSGDLKAVSSPLVSKLKTLLYGAKFRSILQAITGIQIGTLGSTVDMSSNVYGDTNTLLCHDDELLGRRIAYIL